jgi:hypothetical protein
MKTITITAAIATLALGVVATVSTTPASRALARAEGYSQTVMPIAQLTSNARELPPQSFDSF